MKPRWMRNHYSCPDCGIIIPFPDCEKITNFDCERCGAHYSEQDFTQFQMEKWGFVDTQIEEFN